MSDRAKRWTLSGAAIFVGWALSVCSGVWIASAYTTSTQAAQKLHEKQAEDHETRLRKLEECCVNARSDSAWIREALERIEKKLP